MGTDEFIDLLAFRGDDLSMSLTFKDYATQDPIDITGWTVSFTVKDKTYLPDTDAQIAIDVTIHTDPTNGKTGILIPHADTDALEGVYQYDIQYTTNLGIIRTFARGQINFLSDVTRR